MDTKMNAMETMEAQDLQAIETELQQLVASDKTSWVRIYELMERVDREQLYEGKYGSYTAWVNTLATRIKCHVSLLWSRKKAGKMYAEYQTRAAEQGKEVPDIKQLDVSPDNFVLIEKIAGANTAVADELTEKVIAGKLGRSDLKNAWATVRAEKTNVRVNAHDKPVQTMPGADSTEGAGDAAGAAAGAAAQGKAITAADIILSLSSGSGSWLPANHKKPYQQERYKLMTEFAVDAGTSHHARRIDALVIENLSPAERSKVALHGIEIKVSRSDLLGDTKMQEYVDFVDYFWIAVPESLAEDARSLLVDGWGILSIDESKAVSVAVTASQGRPVFRHKTLESAVMRLL